MLKCDSCEKEIPYVFPDIPKRRWNDSGRQQGENALIIRFMGGYGMFDDPIDIIPVDAVICHDCAKALIDNNPWISKFVSSCGEGHVHS